MIVVSNASPLIYHESGRLHLVRVWLGRSHLFTVPYCGQGQIRGAGEVRGRTDWESVSRRFATEMSSAISVRSATIVSVCLSKVCSAEAEKVSEHAGIPVFQREEFFASQEAAVAFHQPRMIQIALCVNPGADGSGQADGGSVPLFVL